MEESRKTAEMQDDPVDIDAEIEAIRTDIIEKLSICLDIMDKLEKEYGDNDAEIPESFEEFVKQLDKRKIMTESIHLDMTEEGLPRYETILKLTDTMSKQDTSREGSDRKSLKIPVAKA